MDLASLASLVDPGSLWRQSYFFLNLQPQNANLSIGEAGMEKEILIT